MAWGASSSSSASDASSSCNSSFTSSAPTSPMQSLRNPSRGDGNDGNDGNDGDGAAEEEPRQLGSPAPSHSHKRMDIRMSPASFATSASFASSGASGASRASGSSSLGSVPRASLSSSSSAASASAAAHAGRLRPAAARSTVLVTEFAGLHHADRVDQALHQENPRRLEVLVGENGILSRAGMGLEGLQWSHAPGPAPMADVLRVHDWAYIKHLKGKCEALQAAAAAAAEENDGAGGAGGAAGGNGSLEGKREGGGGRHVSGEERRRELEEKRGCFGSNPRKLDGDTLLSEASYDAACRGTGAVLHAVDRVVRELISIGSYTFILPYLHPFTPVYTLLHPLYMYTHHIHTSKTPLNTPYTLYKHHYMIGAR